MSKDIKDMDIETKKELEDLVKRKHTAFTKEQVFITPKQAEATETTLKHIEALEKELKEERTEKVKMSANIYRLIRKECNLTNKLKEERKEIYNNFNEIEDIKLKSLKQTRYLILGEILDFIEKGENRDESKSKILELRTLWNGI